MLLTQLHSFDGTAVVGFLNEIITGSRDHGYELGEQLVAMVVDLLDQSSVLLIQSYGPELAIRQPLLQLRHDVRG